VRPPWDDPTDAPIDVVIEPGRAFGTGSHATTRLCLELMLSLARPIGPLLDLGCGSGVLAIAAARLGFDPVTAVDNDPLALDAAAQNAARNGVQIEVRRCDLRASELAATGTVVANLLRPLLIEVASKLVGPPACLIASGLLGHEAKGVAEAFARSGLSETARRSQGEWTALLLERG
jgi:ribosomal protein L11 methyltransferase